MHIVRVKIRAVLAASAFGFVAIVGAPTPSWAQSAAPENEGANAPASPPPPPPAVADDSGIQWSLDARAGMPVLKEGDTKLAADLSAGVRGRTFGVDVRGSAGTYDVKGANQGFVQTDRAEGSLEGFVRFGSPAFSPELRFAGGAAIYDTNVYVPGAAFSEESSVLGRGSLLVGARGITPSIGYSLIFGGGLQVESRDSTAAPTAPNATIQLDDSETVRSRLEARIRLRVPFYRDNLAVRFIEDASIFRLTRDASAIGVDTSRAGTVTQTSSSIDLQQIESRTRLAIDLQALSFGPFMPTIFAGVDVVAQRSDAGNATSVVPMAGLGLLHPEDKR